MDGTGYIGLGSNLGNRLGLLRQALHDLELRGVRILAVSQLYQTLPLYVTHQPLFFNAAAHVSCHCSLAEVLTLLQATERAAGRQRRERYGPRTVDLDMLMWGAAGQVVLRSHRLTIPHPHLAEREFALRPLADLAPDVRHPQLGVTIGELARRVQDDGVEVVEPETWYSSGGDET